MAENSLVEKWKELAQEDLRAADQLKSGASLLLSMFHLQQALEKYLKAYIVLKINQQPPYIHNLIQLSEEAKLTENLNESHKDLLDELNPYYINIQISYYKKTVSGCFK